MDSFSWSALLHNKVRAHIISIYANEKKKKKSRPESSSDEMGQNPMLRIGVLAVFLRCRMAQVWDVSPRPMAPVGATPQDCGLFCGFADFFFFLNLVLLRYTVIGF